MPRNPLAEVFGYPTDDFSAEAERHRRERLCPFHNNAAGKCTKVSVTDPLGVCSVFEGDAATIVCPVRFREGWRIADDAASFFFAAGTPWVRVSEVSLADQRGADAGNIDLVLAAHDGKWRVVDFGALEVQAVYNSGNVRDPFTYYMANPEERAGAEWPRDMKRPRPDYRSSSRKRLFPQIIAKGTIVNAWGKKFAVVVQRRFFNLLPTFTEVAEAEADFAWLVCDLVREPVHGQYRLTLEEMRYTQFAHVLSKIEAAEAGTVDDFLQALQARLDKQSASRVDVPEATVEPVEE